MFTVEGVFGEKIHPQGHVLRTPYSFTQALNTEAGVARFIEEQKPFRSIKVTTFLGEDVTSKFVGDD